MKWYSRHWHIRFQLLLALDVCWGLRGMSCPQSWSQPENNSVKWENFTLLYCMEQCLLHAVWACECRGFIAKSRVIHELKAKQPVVSEIAPNENLIRNSVRIIRWLPENEDSNTWQYLYLAILHFQASCDLSQSMEAVLVYVLISATDKENIYC